MAYKIAVSPNTQKEIENAIDYYALYSKLAPARFIDALQYAYNTLAEHPYFRVCYKNVRVLKLKKFPYSLYFIIDESQNTVNVISCFHNKRNPDRRPAL